MTTTTANYESLPLVRRIAFQRYYLYDFVAKAKLYGWRTQTRYTLMAPVYRRRFDALNRASEPTRIRFAEDVEVRVHPESVSAFHCHGRNSAEIVEEFQSFLSLTKNRRCLLDVGALYGAFSIAFAARPNAASYAFEPSQQPFEMLTANETLNPTFKHHSLRLAVGAETGKMRMSFEGPHLVFDPSAPESIEVEVTTIDDFVGRECIVPDVIKIDVEGFELSVLKGGKRFLAAHSPVIFLETHAPMLPRVKASVEEMVSLLNALGYHFYDAKHRLIKDPVKFLSPAIKRVVCSKDTL